jgi:hypothetical protein
VVQVPHAAATAAAGGARAVLRGGDLAGAALPARARRHLPRPQAGQRPARPRGAHQAHRLRHVQGTYFLLLGTQTPEFMASIAKLLGNLI